MSFFYFWAVIMSPFGPFCHNGGGPVAGWWPGFGHAYYTGPLLNVTATALDMPIPLGGYKAHVGIDTVPNGVLNLGRNAPRRDDPVLLPLPATLSS
jgi:hypothetical protein